MEINHVNQIQENTKNAISQLIAEVSLSIKQNRKVKLLLEDDFYKNLKINANGLFELDSPSYLETGLGSIISSETLAYHNQKHHQNYLNALNKQKEIIDSALAKALVSDNNHITYMLEYFMISIELKAKLEIMGETLQYYNPLINDAIQKVQNLFNNVAQCINHSFYWQSMTNNIESQENTQQSNLIQSGKIKDIVYKSFGGEQKFEEKFLAKGTHFASAWIWLVMDINKEIFLFSTSNADNPLQFGFTPLLVCDIWEHAYYIDYRNDRMKYIKEFLTLINWKFVKNNYDFVLNL